MIDYCCGLIFLAFACLINVEELHFTGGPALSSKVLSTA
jgi:hypothetical protein